MFPSSLLTENSPISRSTKKTKSTMCEGMVTFRHRKDLFGFEDDYGLSLK